MPTGKHLEVNILLNFPGVWKAWFIIEAHLSTQVVITSYITLLKSVGHTCPRQWWLGIIQFSLKEHNDNDSLVPDCDDTGAAATESDQSNSWQSADHRLLEGMGTTKPSHNNNNCLLFVFTFVHSQLPGHHLANICIMDKDPQAKRIFI